MNFKDENNNQIYLVVVENQNKDKIDIDKLQEDIASQMGIQGFENVRQDHQVLEEGQCDCGECIDQDDLDFEKFFNEMLDIYTDSIMQSNGCPNCIRNLLDDFGADLLNNLAIEEEEDDDDGNMPYYH